MLRPWPATLHALSGETFCRKATVPYDETAGRPALGDTVHLSGADGSEYLGSILAVHSTNDQETIVIVPPPPWEPCMETASRRAEVRAIDDLAHAALRLADSLDQVNTARKYQALQTARQRAGLCVACGELPGDSCACERAELAKAAERRRAERHAKAAEIYNVRAERHNELVRRRRQDLTAKTARQTLQNDALNIVPALFLIPELPDREDSVFLNRRNGKKTLPPTNPRRQSYQAILDDPETAPLVPAPSGRTLAWLRKQADSQ